VKGRYGMKVLSFDPSGNYDEGKGTSGYAISLDSPLPHKLGDIKGDDYDSRQAYWFAHRELIEKTFPDYIVIESYRLFGNKAKEQVGSSLETPMLIGYLEMVAYEFCIPTFIQDPTTKTRHSDAVLVKMGVIERKGLHYYYRGELTNLHKRDAMRHNMYFVKYNQKKVVK
jgi:hypothetical protein